MWIPDTWETYIIGEECIMWIPDLWKTYVVRECCIMWIPGIYLKTRTHTRFYIRNRGIFFIFVCAFTNILFCIVVFGD